MPAMRSSTPVVTRVMTGAATSVVRAPVGAGHDDAPRVDVGGRRHAQVGGQHGIRQERLVRAGGRLAVEAQVRVAEADGERPRGGVEHGGAGVLGVRRLPEAGAGGGAAGRHGGAQVAQHALGAAAQILRRAGGRVAARAAARAGRERRVPGGRRGPQADRGPRAADRDADAAARDARPRAPATCRCRSRSRTPTAAFSPAPGGTWNDAVPAPRCSSTTAATGTPSAVAETSDGAAWAGAATASAARVPNTTRRIAAGYRSSLQSDLGHVGQELRVVEAPQHRAAAAHGGRCAGAGRSGSRST